METLDQSTADLIMRCVAYHNRAFLPEDESERCLFFARLLRDADKLDILRVVTDYYQRKAGDRNGAIELGLPRGRSFPYCPIDKIQQDDGVIHHNAQKGHQDNDGLNIGTELSRQQDIDQQDCNLGTFC
ncbi:MAG: hypothetical protein B1H12_01110 [Desulfobacteraceae bacterium 4484_190.2]|nr:MAG: hypothetical protein B1H12_01110 [Desulfobacteraceae bacterium 4484_190.2]